MSQHHFSPFTHKSFYTLWCEKEKPTNMDLSDYVKVMVKLVKLLKR